MQSHDEKDKEIDEEKVETQTDTVELQKRSYEKKQAKLKKRKIAIIIISIILFLFLIFSIIFALINVNNNKIISGISVNGINMSGLTKEELKEKLETIIKEKKDKEISLKYKDFETGINPKLIEVNYKIDDIVEEAYNTGRDSNIFINNYNILFTLIGKKNIDIDVSLNEEALNKILKDNSAKLPGAIKEASYYTEDEKLIITKGKKGVVIDIESTVNKIKQTLNDINNNGQDYIDIPVNEKEPDDIDIDAIYKEVHKEPKDAYYEKNPFKIYPEVNGVDFDVDEAKKLLEEEKEEYKINLKVTKPKVTIDTIGTEAFPNRLSIFTTRYNAGDVNRTTNLRLACQKIDGKVVLSGETFSYNKTLGERTIAAGYKEAKIYAGGKVVDGLGGGICQISSTLYNAVLMANLEIVQRSNHQFVTSYLPAGRDATVVYGAIDFKFKNTRKYPIKLKASLKNGIATIAVYGMKTDKDYTVTFSTRTVGTIPFTTKYIDDSTLEAGKEVVMQRGHNGIQTETYIIKSLNGKVVSRSLLSKDTYSAMQKIVKRSTKSKEATTESKNEKKTETKTKIQTEIEKKDQEKSNNKEEKNKTENKKEETTETSSNEITTNTQTSQE